MRKNGAETQQQIVTELHKLIEEQVQTLHGELGPLEVVAYAARKKRIDALLELLSRPLAGEK